MNKFDPPRGELKHRLFMSSVILGLLIAAIAINGVPSRLAGVELFLFGGAFALFLGGTSLWKLTR